MDSKKFMILLITLISLTIYCYAVRTESMITNLSCYGCNNSFPNSGMCNNSVMETEIPLINCDAAFPKRPKNSTLICLSAFIKYYGREQNRTGIHRECAVQHEDVTSYCDWFKEQTNNNNALLTSCETCTSTRCNNVTFNHEGKIINDNSAAASIFPTFLLTALLLLLAAFNALLR